MQSFIKNSSVSLAADDASANTDTSIDSLAATHASTSINPLYIDSLAAKQASASINSTYIDSLAASQASTSINPQANPGLHRGGAPTHTQVFRSSSAHETGVRLSLDSAADIHLLNSKRAQSLLTNIEPAHLKVFGVSTVPAIASEKGHLRLNLAASDGKRYGMDLGVAYSIDDLPVNILSIALMLDQGAVVHLEKGRCYLQPTAQAPHIPLTQRGGQFHLDLGDPQLDSKCSYSGEAEVYLGTADLQRWHERFGHCDMRDIVRWHRLGLLPGLKLTGRHDCTRRCVVCTMLKARRQPIFSTLAFEEPASKIGHLIHADLKSSKVTSLQGYRYALVFVDMYSRLTILYFLRQKSETSLMLHEFIAELKRYGHQLRTMKTDRGSEFYSGDGETFTDHDRRLAEFTQICKETGGHHTVTPTEHKAQLAEAAIKVVFDGASTQLWQAYLAPVFWPESAAYMNYSRNRLPHEHLGGTISPMTAFTGQEQRVDHIRVFGCDAYGVIPNNEHKKVAGFPKARRLIFMGFDKDREGYRCFDPVTRRFITQKDVYFFEGMQGRHNSLIQHDRYRDMVEKGVDFDELPMQLNDLSELDKRQLDTIRGLFTNPETPFEEAPRLLQHEVEYDSPTIEDITIDAHIYEAPATVDDPQASPAADLHGEPADQTYIRRPVRTTGRGVRSRRTAADNEFLRLAALEDFTIEFVPNPKTPGSLSYDRYEGYKAATTIDEAIALGASRDDIRWDYELGYIMFPTRESQEPGHIYAVLLPTCPGGSVFGEHLLEVGASIDGGELTEVNVYSTASGGSPFGDMIAELPLEADLIEEFQPDNRAAFATYCFLAGQAGTLHPPTNREMRHSSHPLHEEFVKARDREMDSWTSMGVYKWVPLRTARASGKQILHPLWVQAVKVNANGDFVKAKARCAVNGSQQKPWDSFNPEQISASVAHATTFRLLLSICAMQDLVVCQADITTAFLQADLDEEVYLRPPDELKRPAHVRASTEEWVLLLLKGLYGLKQGGAKFYRALSKFLLEHDFIATVGDPCLLYRRYPNGGVLIVATYVDDLTYGASTKTMCDEFVILLRTRFLIGADEGAPISYMLGMRITQDLTRGFISMAMPAAIRKIAEAHLTPEQLVKMRSVNTPMCVEGVTPIPIDDTTTARADGNYPFREVLGSVMHVGNWVRPDIMYAVNSLAKCAGNPGVVHAKALDRLLGYLMNSADTGIRFSRPSPVDYPRIPFSRASTELLMYSDASFADTGTRRSRLGFVAMYNGGPVSYMASEGRTVDTSTMEAELHAAIHAAKEAVHLSDLLHDLGITPRRECITIKEDNSALIVRAQGGIKAVRALKHVQVRIRFVQWLILEERIIFQYTPTNLQLADIFTKPLPPESFLRLKGQILH